MHKIPLVLWRIAKNSIEVAEAKSILYTMECRRRESKHIAWIFHELRWPASKGDFLGGYIGNMPPQKATPDSRPYRLARRVAKVVTESFNLKGTNCNISTL